MSIRVMSLVWENFPCGGSEKLVMLALADFANDQGGSVHPSISLIGRKCNISGSQARRIVHALIEEGYLCVIGNENGGAPSSTRRYQVNLHLLNRKEPLTTSVGATPGADATPSTDATPRIDATPGTDARQPLAPVRETPSAHATRSVINQRQNHHVQTGFAQFWSAYPKKRSKGDALKAWLKISPAEALLSRILQAVAVAKQSDDWRTHAGKFIPYPATWLRNEGWEDEIATAKPESEMVI